MNRVIKLISIGIITIGCIVEQTFCSSVPSNVVEVKNGSKQDQYIIMGYTADGALMSSVYPFKIIKPGEIKHLFRLNRKLTYDRDIIVTPYESIAQQLEAMKPILGKRNKWINVGTLQFVERVLIDQSGQPIKVENFDL